MSAAQPDASELLDLLTRAAGDMKELQASLDAELKAHKKTRASLKAARDELATRPEAANSEVTSASQAAPFQAKIAELADAITKFEIEIKDLNVRLTLAQTRADAAEASLEGLSLSTLALKNDTAASEQRALTAEQKLAELTLHADSLEAQLTAANEDLESARILESQNSMRIADIENTSRQQLEALKSQQETQRRKDMDSNARSLAIYEEELTELREKLERESAERQHAETEFTRVHRELESLLDERDRVLQEIDAQKKA